MIKPSEALAIIEHNIKHLRSMAEYLHLCKSLVLMYTDGATDDGTCGSVGSIDSDTLVSFTKLHQGFLDQCPHFNSLRKAADWQTVSSINNVLSDFVASSGEHIYNVFSARFVDTHVAAIHAEALQVVAVHEKAMREVPCEEVFPLLVVRPDAKA